MPSNTSPVIALDARLVGTRATGDATYWRGLIEGLTRLDVDGTFLLFSNGPKPEFVPERSSIRWISLPSRSSRWWSLVAFPLAARRLGAQAIHAQYNLSPLVGANGITTIHDVSFRIEPSWFRPRDRWLLNAFVGPSIRRAKAVLTVSETSGRDIGLHFPDAIGKTHVAPLAAGFGIQPISIEEAQSIVRGKIGISDPYVLTVGTRWPRKNMELALDAVELLPKHLPHRIVVTGKPGWGEDRVGTRAIPTGFVDDRTLSALYRCADLYLAPSRYEGFGLTLLEAFKMKCPVICSIGGAHPEVAGDAARILDSWAPESWSQAIQDLLDDSSKLESMRRMGVQREKEFDWMKTAKLTWEVYRTVCG